MVHGLQDPATTQACRGWVKNDYPVPRPHRPQGKVGRGVRDGTRFHARTQRNTFSTYFPMQTASLDCIIDAGS